jgi:hypothetical protein
MDSALVAPLRSLSHAENCPSTSNFWLNSGILYESGAHLSAFVMLRLSAAAANT